MPTKMALTTSALAPLSPKGGVGSRYNKKIQFKTFISSFPAKGRADAPQCPESEKMSNDEFVGPRGRDRRQCCGIFIADLVREEFVMRVPATAKSTDCRAPELPSSEVASSPPWWKMKTARGCLAHRGACDAKSWQHCRHRAPATPAQSTLRGGGGCSACYYGLQRAPSWAHWRRAAAHPQSADFRQTREMRPQPRCCALHHARARP